MLNARQKWREAGGHDAYSPATVYDLIKYVYCMNVICFRLFILFVYL